MPIMSTNFDEFSITPNNVVIKHNPKELKATEEEIIKDLASEDIQNKAGDLSTHRFELEAVLDVLKQELKTLQSKREEMFGPTDKYKMEDRLATEIADVERDLEVIGAAEEKHLELSSGKRLPNLKLLDLLIKESAHMIRWRDEIKKEINKIYKKKDAVSKERARVDKIKLKIIRDGLLEMSHKLEFTMQAKEKGGSFEDSAAVVKRAIAERLIFPALEKEKTNIKKIVKDSLVTAIINKFKPEEVLRLSTEQANSLAGYLSVVVADKIKPMIRDAMSEIAYKEFEATDLLFWSVVEKELITTAQDVIREAIELAKSEAQKRKQALDEARQKADITLGIEGHEKEALEKLRGYGKEAKTEEEKKEVAGLIRDLGEALSRPKVDHDDNRSMRELDRNLGPTAAHAPQNILEETKSFVSNLAESAVRFYIGDDVDIAIRSLIMHLIYNDTKSAYMESSIRAYYLADKVNENYGLKSHGVYWWYAYYVARRELEMMKNSPVENDKYVIKAGDKVRLRTGRPFGDDLKGKIGTVVRINDDHVNISLDDGSMNVGLQRRFIGEIEKIVEPAVTESHSQQNIEHLESVEKVKILNNELLKSLSGMKEDVACAMLSNANIRFRITKRNGEDYVIFMNYVPDRVNLQIDNGVVTSAITDEGLTHVQEVREMSRKEKEINRLLAQNFKIALQTYGFNEKPDMQDIKADHYGKELNWSNQINFNKIKSSMYSQMDFDHISLQKKFQTSRQELYNEVDRYLEIKKQEYVSVVQETLARYYDH